MNKSSIVIAACAVFLGLSGCALTTEKIEIQYIPQPSVAQIPGASAISVKVQVADQRQDKSKVSSKKNGYGMEMAPILAIEEVAITVRKAIEVELEARGFKLGSDSALVEISGDLTRFYNDHKVGFFSGDAVADINMSISVKTKQGVIVYTRQLVAQGIEANTQLMTGKNAKRALDRALGNGMKILFEDQEFLKAMIKTSPSAPK